MFSHGPCSQWWKYVSNGWGDLPARNEAGHNGIDFSLPVGTPIIACHSGIVRVSGFQKTGFGLVIVIANIELETTYAHNSKLFVDLSDTVEGGDVIGQSGDTGNSTGPHLHFGLRINPWRYHGRWNGYSDPTYALLAVQSSKTKDAFTG